MSLKDKIDALKASWNAKKPAEKKKIVLVGVVALALLAIGIAGIWFAMQKHAAEIPKEQAKKVNVTTPGDGFEKEGITLINISEKQEIEISGKPAVGFGLKYSGSPNAIVATFETNGAAEFDGKNIKFNLTPENPSMDLSATNLTKLELNVAGSGCIFPGAPTTETMQLCRDLIDKLK